ncbi:hypothetical protein ABOM_005450 [Aspergillus bombycis]|uniref:Uncharacterized protein n=1 Tax=Aspergillus bombycis TaxID=109264 RepID=A0A1F8A1U2_9EURO|nr:hypothetical protein ABOM_005450 [Aspergillus bombycis]OGM45657.1 hypothetical protein ABOM_005450 [Aspergillus bombycis]
MLATVYALTFQAHYMADGLVDFAIMVRGCSIITRRILNKYKGSEMFKLLTDDAIITNTLPRIPPTPYADAENLNTSVETIQSIEPLLSCESHRNAYRALFNTYDSLKRSARDGFVAFTEFYDDWGRMSNREFMEFLDPGNYVSRLLFLHFVVASIMLRPVFRILKEPRLLMFPKEELPLLQRGLDIYECLPSELQHQPGNQHPNTNILLLALPIIRRSNPAASCLSQKTNNVRRNKDPGYPRRRDPPEQQYRLLRLGVRAGGGTTTGPDQSADEDVEAGADEDGGHHDEGCGGGVEADVVGLFYAGGSDGVGGYFCGGAMAMGMKYNSTIFAITSANSYRVFIGPEGFDKLDVQNITSHDGDTANDVLLRLHAEAQNGTLQRLDMSQCINAYATDFQTTYGSLILVTNDTDQAGQYQSVQQQATFLPVENLAAQASDPYKWICSSQKQAKYRTCSQLLPDVKDQVSENNWYVYGYRVRYCLAERPPQRCKLEYSLPLAIIVVAFNLVKAIIIGYTAISATTKPILTTGDAVASFMQRPDEFTRGQCLLTAESVKRRPYRPSYKSSTFNSTPKRWHTAVSGKRYLLGLVSYTVAIVTVISLCAFGVSSIRDKSTTWTMGLGAVNAQTLITGTGWVTSLISNALIANTPQLLFSMIYFTFNAIFTAMTLAAEWSRYANHRKGLRVSGTPENAQRSSYFLSLPYRFAVPALTFSAILHWLISQSLFLVGIESYTEDLQRNPTRDVITCGYSPPAMVSAIVVGVVMMAWLVGFSFRRLESGMPVAGSCSLAIAAACHPTLSLKGSAYVEEEEEEEGKLGAEQMRVQWGVTSVDADGEGHCSFSSGEVGVPEDGKIYR